MRSTRAMIALSAALLAAPAAAAVLVEDGRARCALVVPAAGDETIYAAAEDLRDHLRRMSGATVPLISGVPPRGVLPVYVGVAPPGERLPVSLGDEARFRPDGYLILADDRRVALLAPRPEGVANAVYGLLEDHLGCHWFTPGEIGIHVPPRSTVAVSLPGGWQAVRPSFELRSPWYNGNANDRTTDAEKAQMRLWRTRNRAGGLRGYAGHNWSAIFPKALQEREPDLAPFFNGRRNPGAGQVCLSHPRAVPTAVAYFRRVFRERPALDYYSFAQNDGEGWCECPACLALASNQGARMLLFSNRVARQVAREVPGKGIAILPYAGTIEPPEEHIGGEPGLRPVICSYHMEQVRPKTDRHPSCQGFRRRAERWLRQLPRAWSYDYIGWYPGPWTLFSKLQREQNYYRRLGYTGMLPEYLDRNLGTDVHMWLSFRIAWDKDLHVEDLLRAFYPAYFGEAAGDLRAIYERFEQQMLSVGGSGEAMDVPRLYPVPLVEDALARIEAAKAKVAGDATRVARIERDAHCLRLTRLWLESWSASGRFRRTGAPADRTRAAQACGAYLAALDALDGTLTVGKAARRHVAATLASLGDPGTRFTAAGPFAYRDGLDDGGKVHQALRRSGFTIGTYGLELPPRATGELVYDIRAGEGLRFRDARLVRMYFALPEGGHNEIAVSTDEGRTWTPAFQDTRMWGSPAEYSLTPHLAGAARFLLRFRVENSSRHILAIDHWAIEGEIARY